MSRKAFGSIPILPANLGRLMIEYYVYPDGSAYSCEEWTLDELISSGHSDDCLVLEVPDDVDDCEEWCYEQVMSVNLGTSTNQKSIC